MPWEAEVVGEELGLRTVAVVPSALEVVVAVEPFQHYTYALVVEVEHLMKEVQGQAQCLTSALAYQAFLASLISFVGRQPYWSNGHPIVLDLPVGVVKLLLPLVLQ